MAQVYTVTASTSVVLVNTVGIPNTIVYLSSVSYPGHIVGIRDTTGSPAITGQPIIVSTVQGVRFYDGTFSTLINVPFGSLTLSSKNPTTWQVLNTEAFQTSLSNAFVSTLTSKFSYTNIVYSLVERISTSYVGHLDVTNSIELGGTTQIVGDITVGGNVDFFSTLDVFQKLTLSTNATFAANFSSLSSVLIKGPLTVGGFMSTVNSLRVDTLQVDQCVFAEGALLSPELSVTTLFLDTLTLGGGLQTANSISTQSNAFLRGDVTALGRAFIHSTIQVGSSVYVTDNLHTSSFFQTQWLSSLGHVSIGQDAFLMGQLRVEGSVSSFGTTTVGRMMIVDTDSFFSGSVTANDLTRFNTMTALGNLSTTFLHTSQELIVGGDAFSYGSFFQVSDLSVQGSVGIGNDLISQSGTTEVGIGFSTVSHAGVGDSMVVAKSLTGKSGLRVGDTMFQRIITSTEGLIHGNLSTGFLNVVGNMFVEGGLTVAKILGASTLGAPVDLQVTSLNLSNILRVNNQGYVPRLDMNAFPDKIFVGDPTVDRGTTLAVEGILLNRSTIRQPDTHENWYGSQVVASTFSIPTPLSTTIIGPITQFKPFLEEHGVLLTGTFLGLSSFFYSSNVSTNFTQAPSGFSGLGQGTRLAFDGISRWVAVGLTVPPAKSILYSDGGYQWTTSATGGFTGGGQSVKYGGGLWVATGIKSGGEASIQYSANGAQWNNSINAFSGRGNDATYNGSNLWVAAGVPTGIVFGSAPGIKYSGDGITWQDATLIPPIPFTGGSVGYANGQWIVTEYLGNNLALSSDGINYSYIGTSYAKTRIAYNGAYWVAGGVFSADPRETLLFSPNGFIWIPATTGGFTNRCEDVVWDSVRQVWYAVGYNNPPTTLGMFYSVDGQSWLPIVFPTITSASGVAVGRLIAPDTDNYLTFNLQTIVHSTLSSFVLYASTINASTIVSDAFTGDGGGLRNVTAFRESIFTSSFLASNAYALDITAQRLQTEFMTVSDSINVSTNKFVSTVNIWVATGADSESNGNVQSGFTGLNWTRGIGPSFKFYGRSVIGNCNATNPLYVAVGADSVTANTIQYSFDTKTWSPANQGGFDVEVDGIKQGNSVAYSSNLGTWVAAGNNAGKVSTVFYSTDAFNWFSASNAFADTTRFVAGSPLGFVALGTTGVKFSPTGTVWYDSATSITFDTVAYGKIGPSGGLMDTWLGFSNLDVYQSANGDSWFSLSVGSLQQRVVSAIYGGTFWVGVGSNIIQYSSNGGNWNAVTTSFAPDTIFNAVAYNSNQNRWVAGAVSTTADKSLWSSSNLQTWDASLTGGFSTSILTSGIGFGIFTSSLYTFAVGQGSFGGISPVKQNILSVSATGTGDFTTTDSLTLANSSNVFQSQVRGIYRAPSELYTYVAVGDGRTPQKTIARSLDAAPDTWIPAITGGFSTTGYGVTYYQDRWIAVGDAQVSTNVIQYSPDGANWFGTNTANALRRGARGIATGKQNYYSTLVAVGKDVTTSTIAKSLDGFSWTVASGSYFQGQGNAVAGGLDFLGSPNYVAVGSDTRGSLSTIIQSSDGEVWTNITTGGFSGGGYGVAYGSNIYVAVGVDSVNNNTIQYSTDGGTTFQPTTSGGFTSGGYGIAFNAQSNLFFAVGEDLGALRKATIKYSTDATSWSNISSIAGFQSQTTLGAAYGVFSQEIEITETIPYLELSNLIVYDRSEPLLYPKATIRLQSSCMVFNESMYINLSSQVVCNSNVPYNESTVLTVYGDIYASSFLYTGALLPSDTLLTSSLIMSTVSSVQLLQSIHLTTPTLGINAPEAKSVFISTYTDSFYNNRYESVTPANVLTVNNVLFTTATSFDTQQVGIQTSKPMYDVDVNGSFGVSSFSTGIVYARTALQFKNPTGPFVRDALFSMGSASDSLGTSNSILTTQSSMLVNSVLTVNLSSQKVGFYTMNPQFSLDVRSQTYLTLLSTPIANTSLLFLTLQSE